MKVKVLALSQDLLGLQGIPLSSFAVGSPCFTNYTWLESVGRKKEVNFTQWFLIECINRTKTFGAYYVNWDFPTLKKLTNTNHFVTMFFAAKGVGIPHAIDATNNRPPFRYYAPRVEESVDDSDLYSLPGPMAGSSSSSSASGSIGSWPDSTREQSSSYNSSSRRPDCTREQPVSCSVSSSIASSSNSWHPAIASSSNSNWHVASSSTTNRPIASRSSSNPRPPNGSSLLHKSLQELTLSDRRVVSDPITLPAAAPKRLFMIEFEYEPSNTILDTAIQVNMTADYDELCTTIYGNTVFKDMVNRLCTPPSPATANRVEIKRFYVCDTRPGQNRRICFENSLGMEGPLQYLWMGKRGTCLPIICVIADKLVVNEWEEDEDWEEDEEDANLGGRRRRRGVGM